MPDPDLCTTDAQRAALGRLLSPERLGTYRDAAADTCDELDLYLFNMNTASAFLGPLHVLEVVLRNAMHEQLVRACGRSDWWNSSAVPLSDRHWRWIDEGVARTKASRSTKNLPAATSADQVADFDFRIWTTMLERGPRGRGQDYERVLWQPITRHAFPHYRGQRDWLDKLANRARNLRNRVSHHEPIFDQDLRRAYEGILALVGYVSPDVRAWLAARARAGVVVDRRPPVDDPVRWF